ncbi:MAG TPA: dephospho-CoA kinase [Gemmataceae bacterium]|jgi:dephospho-CoA kinase|nr:dephospho-CoA kinase [Gemmataceae bacterium]
MDGPQGDRKKCLHSTKPIVGLIGGIGAGKSLAAGLFAERGARVIDADALGHAALKEDAIRAQVRDRWSQAVMDPDGQINRRRLGSIVFASPQERAALQGMVFPWIDRRIREEIAQAEADPAVRLIVLDAAIMLETGWDAACSRLVYIDAPREQRLARLVANRGWTAQELTSREQAQMDAEQKRARANDVLLNYGSPAELACQIDHWFEAHASLFA